MVPKKRGHFSRRTGEEDAVIGYLIAGTVVVVVGVGIVRHRRKRRAEEEQRAEEQRQFDLVVKEQNDRIMRENVEAVKLLKAAEEKRVAEVKRQETLRATFKERFGKTFVEANGGWHRNVLEAEVDQTLHATAYALHEAYKRELECQSQTVNESAKLGAKAASTQLRQRFWALFEVARDVGLPVRWRFIPHSRDKFVGVLSASEKDEMVAQDEQYSKPESVEATYRAYVHPLPRGYFTGDVTFLEVKTVEPVAYEYKDFVVAKSNKLVAIR